jgi:hypothetical protein
LHHLTIKSGKPCKKLEKLLVTRQPTHESKEIKPLPLVLVLLPRRKLSLQNSSQQALKNQFNKNVTRTQKKKRK